MSETERRLDGLGTEGRLRRARDLDLMTTTEQVALIVAENQSAVDSLVPAQTSIARAVELITESLRRGGRLLYFGAGTAGRLGILDASEVPPTFSVSDRVIGVIAGGEDAVSQATEGIEDDETRGRADVAAHEVEGDDVVVAISASGRTPYCLAALQAARETGATTVCVVSNPGSPLAAESDVGIVLETGPEVISGSTRMKAGTAQKVVLNILSTLPMVALGNTLGDLMVGLRLSNEKLERRGQRIVMEATGVDEVLAATTLAQARNDVKKAVVMLLTNVDADEAAARLEEAGGDIRKVIGR